MDNALKRAVFKTAETPDEMRESIREVCWQLENARTRFEMASDGDMIEACIYEMESLRARYRYLLKKARTRDETGADGHAAEW